MVLRKDTHTHRFVRTELCAAATNHLSSRQRIFSQLWFLRDVTYFLRTESCSLGMELREWTLKICPTCKPRQSWDSRCFCCSFLWVCGLARCNPRGLLTCLAPFSRQPEAGCAEDEVRRYYWGSLFSRVPLLGLPFLPGQKDDHHFEGSPKKRVTHLLFLICIGRWYRTLAYSNICI